jgi:hypothetical protein
MCTMVRMVVACGLPRGRTEATQYLTRDEQRNGAERKNEHDKEHNSPMYKHDNINATYKHRQLIAR